jgi:hypothetical protein
MLAAREAGDWERRLGGLLVVVMTGYRCDLTPGRKRKGTEKGTEKENGRKRIGGRGEEGKKGKGEEGKRGKGKEEGEGKREVKRKEENRRK